MELDAVDHQCRPLFAVKWPAERCLELGAGPGHESPAHCTLAGREVLQVRDHRLQRPLVLPRAHANQHLLEGAIAEGVLRLKFPVERRDDLFTVLAHARPPDLHLAAAEHELSLLVTPPAREVLTACVAWTTKLLEFLFEEGGDQRHSSAEHHLSELRAYVDGDSPTLAVRRMGACSS